jgi:hypothetical protein
VPDAFRSRIIGTVGKPRESFRVAPQYQPILREIGLDGAGVFDHPMIKVWRSIPERENCTLDADLDDGRRIRFHIKRFKPARGMTTPAEDEARGIRALQVEGIPTAPLVGWGKLRDGHSFILTEDLTGYRDVEKLLREGVRFDALLNPTADLTARLHSHGLHHRDLYLCHFFAKEREPSHVRLIDAGRVKRLPGWPMRNRWIVKDLAAFWFSTMGLPVSEDQRSRWLDRYIAQRDLKSGSDLRGKIERKAASIARHDARLREKQKNRNISIPQ